MARRRRPAKLHSINPIERINGEIKRWSACHSGALISPVLLGSIAAEPPVTPHPGTRSYPKTIRRSSTWTVHLKQAPGPFT
jgi:hypothetical protein